jgi:hypothetical protein
MHDRQGPAEVKRTVPCYWTATEQASLCPASTASIKLLEMLVPVLELAC